MSRRLGWGVRMAPLVATQAFLWATFAMFVFGPWDWPLSDPDKLYGFVIAAHLALLLGYLSAAHRNPTEGPPNGSPKRLLTISLWATLFVLPLTGYARTGQWMPDFIGAIRNPGQAYQDAHVFAEGGANFASYLRVLAAPALAILFPIGVFYWAKWNWTTRLTLLAAMGSVILLALGTGQRRDMADLLVTVPFLVAASHVAGVTRLSRRTILVGAATTCLAIAGFSAYFVYSHVSRVGRDTASYGANPVTQQMPNIESPVLAPLPEELRPGAVALLNYLTTGYYGLGLALERPVQPMWGLGHSMFLTRNAQRLMNDESFESRSLPVQISDKDGFRYPTLWCSAYPYFANDLGFVGTVLMLFLVGRGLALSWIDLLGGRNAYAGVMVSLLLMLIIYLPATNRVLQDGEGITAFYVWLILWASGRLLLTGARRRLCPRPA